MPNSVLKFISKKEPADRELEFRKMAEQFMLSQEFQIWLLDRGFLSAKASRNHHGNYPGGLFDHSMAVAAELRRMTDRLGLSWALPRSPEFVGLFHDLCKLDYSTSGHGEKSVRMIEGFVRITPEERACIRWHMGAFDAAENWAGYSSAVAKYNNVLYAHTADMIASNILGI